MDASPAHEMQSNLEKCGGVKLRKPSKKASYKQNAAYNGTDFMPFSKPKFFAEIRIE